MGLLELPDDILLKTLAASGCARICMAATTCRRLRAMKTTLGEYPVFSSAMAQGADLDEAVADVCNRALTGMLGAVDFALVFESNASPRTAVPGFLQLLRSKLPQGVAILGSSSEGLMGIASSGSPLDLDTGSTETDGVCHVALLLGRLPGSSVRTFATAKHLSKTNRMDGLRTLAQEGLQTQLVILLADDPDGISGYRGLLGKLQPPNQGNGGMVIAGGLTSGNDWLFYSTPERALVRPRVVALAICTPCQRMAELAAPLPPASPPQSGFSAAALTLQGLEPVDQTVWSNFTAEAHDATHVILRGPDIHHIWLRTEDFGGSVALWRGQGGVAGGASCMEAAAGGQPLVLLKCYMAELTENIAEDNGIVAQIKAFEGPSLEQLLAPQPGTSLLAQLVTYTSEGTQRLMRSELPKMRDFVTASATAMAGSIPRTGHLAWEGYEAVRRSAREAGARSGSSALVLFSCTGRGVHLHGVPGVELGLLDQVAGGELPLVGMYCNNELGPHLRGGYMGWSVASSGPPSQSNPSANPSMECDAAAGDAAASTLPSQSNSGSVAGVAAAAACAAGGGMPGVADDGGAGDHARSQSIRSRVQDASDFQSFTSVFVALSAC